MADEMSQLSIRIDESLASLSPTVLSETYILRVDELLYKENKNAYEPEILAIGPYHRNRDHLRMMERHKLLYLQEFLTQNNESSVDKYVKGMKELEERARNCYGERVKLNSDEFVEMMLLDGIFIIELLRNISPYDWRKTDILQLGRIQSILVRDIFLFENQLPFFVLIRLLDVANERNDLMKIDLWGCLYGQISFMLDAKFTTFPLAEGDFRHVLGAMHSAMRPSFLGQLGRGIFFPKLTRCVAELQEAGIKFEVRLRFDSILDIKFENGIMTIPQYRIDENMEIYLRNLIAYEQYNHENEWAYVTSYLKFMNDLIKSPKDVELLRKCRIFNYLEGMDDESTFSLFNKLSGAVFLPNSRFCYYKICNQIDEHCKRRQNRWMAKWKHNSGIWMAKLKQDYFNSPWSVLSLIGAFVLLVLTAIQTVCSMKQA